MRFKITCSWKGYKDYSFLEVITANAIPSAFPNAPTTIPSRPSASPTLSHQPTLSISPTAYLSKTPSAMPTHTQWYLQVNQVKVRQKALRRQGNRHRLFPRSPGYRIQVPFRLPCHQ